MARGKQKCEECSGGAPEWMVTYGDMMSLLLTFFVLIVSFSSIQLAEFQKAMGSLKGALGVLKSNPSVVKLYKAPTPEILKPSPGSTPAEIEELRSFLEEEEISEEVTLRSTELGIAISIQSPILFDLGRANLKPRYLPLLDRIARMSKQAKKIVIEGHADDLPINTPEYPSNWELSAARALSVLHYFERHGVQPAKMRAVACGEYQPVAPNDTEANRRKNRRVEIYLDFNEEES